MPIDEIKKIAFIGGGTMGSFNSMVAAVAGYDVTVFDVSEEALQNIPARQKEWGELLIENWQLPRERIEAGLERVRMTTDPAEAVRDADLLSESVFERLDLKRDIHTQFDQLCPAKTIMTTNTSTLLLSDIESAVQRGDKFAAMHYHQPSVLVDLVAGPRTSPETMDILKRYIKSTGMTYVLLKKERAGYLHNAMFGALLGTAMMLKVVGGEEIEDIDRAWMLNQKSDVGPFAMMDHVGFNVIMDISEDQESFDDMPLENELMGNLFRPYVERGELGMKTGKGFYSYPDPAFSKPEFLEGQQENTQISKAMANAVLSTAMSLVIDGHADMEDVDRCWMLTHDPEIGPFGMMDKKGLDVLHAEIEESVKENPILEEPLKPIFAFLKTFIEKGELGAKAGKGFYSYPNPEFKIPGFLLQTD